jgi:hypothetical protein
MRDVGQRLSTVVFVALCLLLHTPIARAQAPGAAGAEALFDQAKVQMAAGNYSVACAKFSESYRMDPAMGTLIGLALCHEALGQTASAWAEFVAVADASARDGRADREHLARDRIAALEPELSRLVVQVPDAVARTPGLEVRRDGLVVGPGAWNTPLPVDPGEHVIEASAPRRSSWSARALVGPHAAHASIEVPALAAEAGQRETSTREPGLGTRRTVALVVAAAGLAATAVGAGFGVRAVAEYGHATEHCSVSFCDDPAAAAQSHDSIRDANVANVGILVGLVALGAGAYLWWTAPRTDAPAVAAGISGAGVAARVTW